MTGTTTHHKRKKTDDAHTTSCPTQVIQEEVPEMISIACALDAASGMHANDSPIEAHAAVQSPHAYDALVK